MLEVGLGQEELQGIHAYGTWNADLRALPERTKHRHTKKKKKKNYRKKGI